MDPTPSIGEYNGVRPVFISWEEKPFKKITNREIQEGPKLMINFDIRPKFMQGLPTIISCLLTPSIKFLNWYELCLIKDADLEELKVEWQKEVEKIESQELITEEKADAEKQNEGILQVHTKSIQAMERISSSWSSQTCLSESTYWFITF